MTKKAVCGTDSTACGVSVTDIEGRAFEILSRGRKKLRNHGGPGDPRVAQIGDSILTIERSVAVALAEDIVRDLESRYSCPIHRVPMLAAHPEAVRRIEGRQTTLGTVLAEVGRLRHRSEQTHGR